MTTSTSTTSQDSQAAIILGLSIVIIIFLLISAVWDYVKHVWEMKQLDHIEMRINLAKKMLELANQNGNNDEKLMASVRVVVEKAMQDLMKTIPVKDDK